MDIYELLKAGESVESIRAAFGKELAEANEKLRKEREAERAAHNLAIARENLLDSMIKYIETYLEALFGEPCPFSYEEIREIKQELIDQEKELKQVSHLTPDETKNDFTKFLKIIL